MGAAVGEAQAGTGDQGVYVTRPGLGRYPRADVGRDAAHAPPLALDLAGVEPRANLDPQAPHAVAHRTGAPHGPLRRVECCQEAVAGGVDLLALEAGQLAAD